MMFETKGRSYGIFDHDFVLWVGDLNFRTNVKSLDEALNLIKANKLGVLLSKDQLSIEKSKGNLFREFEESSISFLPTYKYTIGTNELSRDTKREPGWCDRILYKGKNLTQTFYTSLEDFSWSDHKPVAALFNCIIYKSVEGKKAQVLQHAKSAFMDLLKKIVPKPVLSKTEVLLKDVSYGVESFETLNIANKGQSIMEFRINKFSLDTEKSDESFSLVNWLTVKPTFGILEANQSIDIMISVMITVDEAPRLHREPDCLKHGIEIKTSDAQTFRVEIRVTYIKSCFGAKLTLLNSVSEGFATIDQHKTASELIATCEKKLLIPKEIYMLTQWIFKYALKTEKLFVLVGKEDDKIKVRECLGYNQEIPSTIDPYCVADTLMELLESIPEGIVSMDVLTETAREYEEVGDTTDKVCEHFLMKLPSESLILLTYMLAFCKQLLEFSDYNSLTIDTLVKLLCAYLVKIDTTFWDTAYLKEEDNERKVKISQIAIKRKLRFQSIFGMLLT